MNAMTNYFNELKESINDDWNNRIDEFLRAFKFNGIERQLVSYLNLEQLDAFKHCCDNLNKRSGNQEACRAICAQIQKYHAQLFPMMNFFNYKKALYKDDRDYLLRCTFSLTEPNSIYLRKLITVWFAMNTILKEPYQYHYCRRPDLVLEYCKALCEIFNTITYDCKLSYAEPGDRTYNRNFCIYQTTL